MPRLKSYHKLSSAEKLAALIRGTATIRGNPMKELGKAVGLCEASVYNRFRHPDGLTVEEAIGICHKLDIPIEEVRQCLRY